MACRTHALLLGRRQEQRQAAHRINQQQLQHKAEAAEAQRAADCAFRDMWAERLQVLRAQEAQEAADARAIAALELAKTGARLVEQRGVHLEITERLMGRICAEGYDREYGKMKKREFFF